MNLEKVLGNFGKGFGTGIIKLVDPVGTSISYTDKWLTGVGYSSERSPDTVHNQVYKSLYEEPEKKLEGSKDYIPRAVGAVSGIGISGTVIYALYSASPIFGFMFPVVTGIYGLFKTAKKYAHDLFDGERMDSKGQAFQTTQNIKINEKGKEIKYVTEKASFEEGFSYGWENGTHLYMPAVHDVEGFFTGRGLNDSRVESSIKDDSAKVRRNGHSVLGTMLGIVTGTAASILTLGILPLYKSIRDTSKNFKKK